MRTETLTFTRFIAAICVVIYHLGNEIFPFNFKGFDTFFRHSNLFVSYFFFLSGFVMVVAYHNQIRNNKFSKRQYLIKRIARIYPLYFIALLLYIFIVKYFWNQEINHKHFFLNLLMLQSWNSKTALTLNFPGWSLSIEFFFYLIFPFLIVFIYKLKTRITFIIFIVVWMCSQYISITQNYYYNPLIHLNLFYGGIILAKYLTESHDKIQFLKNNSNIVLFVSVLFLIIIMGTKNLIVQYSHNGLLAPLFGLIIIGLIYSNNVITRLFSKSLLIKLGEISYGIYILHIPTVYVVRYINDKLNKGLFDNHQNEFYWYLIFLLFFCTITYYLVELPAKEMILKQSHFITRNKKHRA